MSASILYLKKNFQNVTGETDNDIWALSNHLKNNPTFYVFPIVTAIQRVRS